MTFYEKYQALLEIDRTVTQQMVADGELTPEMGEFRDYMRMDEILYAMEED